MHARDVVEGLEREVGQVHERVIDRVELREGQGRDGHRDRIQRPPGDQGDDRNREQKECKADEGLEWVDVERIDVGGRACLMMQRVVRTMSSRQGSSFLG